MRTYHQYCAMAKALDVIGDRWTLLIVRELLVRGPSRYTDLLHGLPGIATNLLADRLREMEESGILRRAAAPPPVATDLYRLTPRGEALDAVVRELGRWGGPLLAGAPEDDAIRTHWLALPLGIHLRDQTPDRPPVTVEIRCGGEPLVLEAVAGAVRTRHGVADKPDAVVEGSPRLVLGLLLGRVDLATARRQGVRYDGDPKILQRLQPLAAQGSG